MKQSEYKRKYDLTDELINLVILFDFFFTDTGYAFSGQKGNDALVVNVLADGAYDAV